MEPIKNVQNYIQKVAEINQEKLARGGHGVKAVIHSFGCQQNVADGQRIAGIAAQMGYSFTEDIAEADFIIYNTCAIREGAEDRVFGNVGALKHAKQKNPSLVVALCGCMTQQEHVAQRVKTSYPFVDILLGSGAMHRLPELLYKKLTEGGKIFETLDPTFEIVEDMPIRREGKLRAWLSIMNGCDNFCSYCVVPYVRGRERSRNPEKILQEAQEIVALGYKEITLLGQNVNSYGKGLNSNINFSWLLKEICKIPGDFRVKFMTSHPKDCTKELIDTIASEDKIYNHIHLPVQSGSDKILKAMNRHYTLEHYKSLIDYAKEKIPDITVTSDIIVGFPGETYEDFKQTLDLVRYVGYQILFTFIFSSRRGTKAAELEDPISREEKGEWFKELIKVQDNCRTDVYHNMIGQTQTVLVEDKSDDGVLTGKNKANITVRFKGNNEIGDFVDVKITSVQDWKFTAEKIV